MNGLIPFYAIKHSAEAGGHRMPAEGNLLLSALGTISFEAPESAAEGLELFAGAACLITHPRSAL